MWFLKWLNQKLTVVNHYEDYVGLLRGSPVSKGDRRPEPEAIVIWPMHETNTSSNHQVLYSLYFSAYIHNSFTHRLLHDSVYWFVKFNRDDEWEFWIKYQGVRLDYIYTSGSCTTFWIISTFTSYNLTVVLLYIYPYLNVSEEIC